MAYRKSYSKSGYSRSYSNRGSYRSSGRSSSYRSRRPSRPSSSYRSPTKRSYYSSSPRRSTLSTRSKNGYAQYYSRRSGTWKFTHRRVAEKKLGGRIRSGYEVYHINRDKQDNRPSNLTVVSKSKHEAIHGRGRKSRPGRFRLKKWWGKI